MKVCYVRENFASQFESNGIISESIMQWQFDLSVYARVQISKFNCYTTVAAAC